ncbi:MAG: PorT family protein [Prevotella sp.]|nr:PorT family protein [Prevotella sp.]
MGIVLLGTLSASAQLQFGLKGGLDLTKMSTSGEGGLFKNRAGWFVGPSLKYVSFMGLGFDISALYNQRETQLDVYFEDNEQLKPMKTKQIIVPLNLRYDLGLGGLATIFGYAGPQVAFRIGDGVQSLGDLKDTVGDWRLKSSNFSVNVGLGVTLDKLQLSANYNIGLGNTGEVTLRDATDAVYGIFKGKYNAWQINLAYYF